MEKIIFVILTIISSVIAGMGIGGGAILISTLTIFLNFDQKYAQFLNLALFISTAITATIENAKENKIDKSIIKYMPFVVVGAYFGSKTFKKIEINILKKYFNIFLLIIGIYEIISSLIRIIKAKNINDK